MTPQARAYKLQACPNPGKLAELERILAEYRGYLLEDSIEAERQVKAQGRVERYRATKGLDGTQVMRRNSWAQVRGEYKRWEAKAVAKGRKLIASLELEDETLRKELFTLNKYAAWLQPGVLKRPLSQEACHLAYLVFQELLDTIPLPLVGAADTMQLANGIRFEEAKSSLAFDYWVQVPSTVPKRPLRIPLKSNSYFRQAAGKTASTIMLKLEEDGRLVAIAVKQAEAAVHQSVSWRLPPLGGRGKLTSLPNALVE